MMGETGPANEREKKRECVWELNIAKHNSNLYSAAVCKSCTTLDTNTKLEQEVWGVRCEVWGRESTPSHLEWIWCHQMHRKIVASDKTSNADTVFQTHRTTGWCFHCSCVLWSTCRLVGPGDSGSLEISSLTRNWKDYKWNPVRILSKWLWNAKQAKQETWQNNDRWNGK